MNGVRLKNGGLFDTYILCKLAFSERSWVQIVTSRRSEYITSLFHICSWLGFLLLCCIDHTSLSMDDQTKTV